MATRLIPRGTITCVEDKLDFHDVSFSYTSDQLDLNKLSLTIPYGSYAAFVGPSGSGKSTVINLLMRFYDPVRQ